MIFDDLHAHTNLSYCCDVNVGLQEYVDAIRHEDALRSVAVTNHGFAVYFPEDVAWQWGFMVDPSLFDAQREWGNARLSRHLDAVEELADQGLRTGMEVEMMCDGRLTVDPRLVDRLDVLVGSVHWLPASWRTGYEPRDVLREWMLHVQQLLRSGIDVLGHPLRWLSGQIEVVPDELVPMVVEWARQADVAIEINAHYIIDTDVRLLVEAARTGTPVTFCTDAHRRDEIASFEYHIDLMRRAALSADDIVFWQPGGRR